MAEPIVSFLVEEIGKLLREEGKFLVGVSDEAEQLHSELKILRAMLRDTDERQHEAAIVKEWISQCKDVAYEAENVLETHAFRLSSRRSLPILKRYACIFNEVLIRHNVGLEIQSLKARVSGLTRLFHEYGIRAVTERERSSPLQQQWRTRMTYPHLTDDEDFVGFGPEVEKLAEVLVKEEPWSPSDKNRVVSISGMGGSGKTTIARKAYNHPSVRSHFKHLAWVCVSQEWQTRNILKGILISFLPERRNEIEKWRDEEMVEQLARFQEERKCLVVLDDIWSREPWDCVKDAFPRRKGGSKILMTTRNRNVAEFIGPNGYHHQQRLLTEEESWELLKKKAFWTDRRHQDFEDVQNFEDLRKKRVKACGGLPLAVVVLGGILATKHSFSEWNVVCENIRSYLGKGERIDQNEGEVERILALSYTDLPYKLKPCFLYLGVFSEDEEIEVDMLYNLWMAEGMIFTEDRIRPEESMREIADRYMGELVRRCVVMVEEKEKSSYERYESFRIHDLMRDLCRAKAIEEHFLVTLDYRQENDGELVNSRSSLIGTIPRIMISLSRGQSVTKYVPVQMESYKNLRSLLFCGSRFKRNNTRSELGQLKMNRFKKLKSIIFQGLVADHFKLPIEKLIHLRYLKLTNCRVKMSPSSISNLEHLEILDLEETWIHWTKNIPIEAKRLKYLHLPENSSISLQIYVSKDLEVLNGWPSKVFEVKNLSEMTKVREFGNVNHSEYQNMSVFDNILRFVNLEDFSKFLSNSHHLKQVKLACFAKFENEENSAFLRELFKCSVQSLFLVGTLCKLPEHQSRFLTNLVTLTLKSSNIEEDPMKIFEKLPNLQNLQLLNRAFIGEELVCHSMGFPQLRFLVLDGLYNLGMWTIEKSAMTNLSHVEIKSCPELRMIPDELRFISTLTQVVVERMPKEFVERNIHNFHHLPSVVVRETVERYVY